MFALETKNKKTTCSMSMLSLNIMGVDSYNLAKLYCLVTFTLTMLSKKNLKKIPDSKKKKRHVINRVPTAP